MGWLHYYFGPSAIIVLAALTAMVLVLVSKHSAAYLRRTFRVKSALRKIRRDRLASEARLARVKAELPPQQVAARAKARVELRGQVLRRTYRYEDGKDVA